MESSSLAIPREIWSSLSTADILAELSKRQHGGNTDDAPKPQCGSTANAGSYNTALHVGALFLILILSTFTCGLPLITNTSTQTRGRKKFLFYCQHVGTGVLLATAFLHLLPMAFMSLTNPCLPDFFSKRYTPMAGLIAMVAALSVVALESYLTSRGAGHAHAHGGDWDDDEEEKTLVAGPSSASLPLASRRRQHPAAISLDDMEATEGLVAGISPRPGLTPTAPANATTEDARNAPESNADSDSDSDMDLDMGELDPNPADSSHKPLNGRATAVPTILESHQPPTPEEQSRLFLQCLLLEAGILFHSIFIGMALSVESGPTFLVFLLAIAFHQSFEGLALGGRIAAIQLPKRSLRPWLMVLAFGMTTPLGQAIGLIIHTMYDPQSMGGLILVGSMNAISAGLLLFAGLVQLLAEDFLSDKSYKVLSGRKRVKAFASVVGGALLMAAVRAIG
ncbi:related to low affininty zinc transporter [Cephalotrichum gorgonifer]|uniref:Related to low affininty zinc transporter n=1 Tax=Cephalotrichum gorgonifer TaxID=2041049 RepID=A0AAE8SV64_9PEZI|nr:related to low affininty zinc transporter [Cephalotrichum gorgonifer]